MSAGDYLAERNRIIQAHKEPETALKDPNRVLTTDQMIKEFDLDQDLVDKAGPEGRLAVYALSAHRHLGKDGEKSVLELASSLEEKGHGKLAFDIRSRVGEIKSMPKERYLASMTNKELQSLKATNELKAKALGHIYKVAPDRRVKAVIKMFEEGLSRQNERINRLIKLR